MRFAMTVLKIFLRKKWDESKNPLGVIGLLFAALAIVPVIIGGILDLILSLDARFFIIEELEGKGFPIITTSVKDLWLIGGYGIYSLGVLVGVLFILAVILMGLKEFIAWICRNLRESIKEAKEGI